MSMYYIDLEGYDWSAHPWATPVAQDVQECIDKVSQAPDSAGKTAALKELRAIQSALLPVD